MSREKLTKRLIICLSLPVILSVSGCGFLDAYARKGNMKRAQQEIDGIMNELRYDARYSNLSMVTSSDNVGKDIVVQGVVPDQPSLDYLKFLLKIRVSPEFNIRYLVEPQKGPKESG